ncbi:MULTISPECIES: YicC/YloC family endoribonuclease [Acidiphilium]|uniref:YicC family protein n=1 Tax=Acidiphilium iwatense TaxID=768198 RepID=A0ABS9DUL1_9PROT|nr:MULTISPECIES: YicC/YloC family endoribonuclease [Acidiphilium]MCF3946412.1 YicC family protein [Acidiphilium iwatense]
MSGSNIASMTGFARVAGRHEAMDYAWELRSVNGRGLDLRLRLPPGFDALEPALREAAARRLKRGNVSAGLTLKRDTASVLVVDEAALDVLLARALELARRYPAMPAPRAEALLGLPGVIRPSADAGEPETGDAERSALARALAGAFEQALDELVAARAGEGARLAVIVAEMLARIASLVEAAHGQANGQSVQHRARLEAALKDLLGDAQPVSPERLAQEIALLAAKSDVREELDRLTAHIAAANALLAETVPVGRRFDFLMQEFNREANTLCSKSASLELTAIGLDLKAAIEQLREQAQNIE